MTRRSSCLLVPLLFLYLSVDTVHSENDATQTHKRSPLAGDPGVLLSGRDGRDGAKGDKGQKGLSGGRGPSGEKGASGEKGERGPAGFVGRTGDRGETGPRGPPGWKGERGWKGSKGEMFQLNWKQYTWRHGDLRDTGKIKEYRFRKLYSSSALHVVYSGVTAVLCPSTQNCCSRWYFTFNGIECLRPAPIDLLVVKVATRDEPHRTRQMEGYCESVSSGNVVVALHVGSCSQWSRTVHDATTGWYYYTSRILITEVSPSQQ